MRRVEEFQELRPLLFSIAYRILGSVSEAEDAVQETGLGPQWNGHGRYPTNISRSLPRPHQPPAPDGGLAGAAGQAPLLVTSGGAPISQTALQRMRHHGAARAGVALPAGSFRDWVITDLCAPSRART